MQKHALEQVYAVPFGSLTKVQAVRSNVKGFVPFRIPRMSNVWFDELSRRHGGDHHAGGWAARCRSCSSSALITFAMIHLIPGDPAVAIAGLSATPEQIANIRHDLGLDQPLLTQLWRLVRRAGCTAISAARCCWASRWWTRRCSACR